MSKSKTKSPESPEPTAPVAPADPFAPADIPSYADRLRALEAAHGHLTAPEREKGVVVTLDELYVAVFDAVQSFRELVAPHQSTGPAATYHGRLAVISVLLRTDQHRKLGIKPEVAKQVSDDLARVTSRLPKK